MEWINYHHLLYFWVVAKAGGIARASEQLRLAQPTISGQLRVLEETLGEKLFARSGRRLQLTDVGRVVYRYCDEIFSLGRELQDTLKGRPTGRPVRLMVGIADVVPKLIAFRLLKPALSLPEGIQIVCQEDRLERLLAELTVHGLDLILTDAPLTAASHVKAFNHLLGECGVSFVARPAITRLYRKGFPASLDGAPFLMPIAGTSLRRLLDQWFETQGIRPRIVAEFQDSALLKVFGQEGMGIFTSPMAIEKEVCKQYGVSVVGRTDSIKERFYAISIERKLKHPAILAISETAREKLFVHSNQVAGSR